MGHAPIRIRGEGTEAAEGRLKSFEYMGQPKAAS